MDGKEEKTHSSALRFLISSSHVSTSHHGKTTTLFWFRVGTRSFHSSTLMIDSSYVLRARASMSSWICSSRAGIDVVKSASGSDAFAPVSRRTDMADFFSKSFGPSSRRIGTPCGTRPELVRQRLGAREKRERESATSP